MLHRMSRAERNRTQRTRCSKCRKIVPSYDTSNLGSIESGYRKLCGQCFNAESAKLGGLDRFEHLDFQPVRILDCEGQAHEFYFRTRLFLPGVALDAFELRDGEPAGYQFQIIGDPEEELVALFGKLIEKIRRALSIKHLKRGSVGLGSPTKWSEAGSNGTRMRTVGYRFSLSTAGVLRGTNSAIC
jgi:hypothetical protein